MPICSASLTWVLMQQPAGRKGGSLKWCLVMKPRYPRATVHTVSHSPVHVKNNTRRDVTCDKRIIWESQAFLVQAIASIRGDIHSLPPTHLVAWQSTIRYYPQGKGKCGFCFLYGKTLTSPNNNCMEVSLRHNKKTSYARWYLPAGFSAVRGGEREANWQVSGALEWEWSQVTCLPGYPGWTSSLWASLFDSMIYLKVRPSDAKDEITP